MTTDLMLAIGHHLFAFSLLALLVAEWVILTGTPSRPVVRRLLLIDVAYGMAALGSLAVGVCRVVWGAKPPAFYTGNPVFWTKMGLWAVIALISLVPTIRYIIWWRSQELPAGSAFASTRRLVAWEALLFAGVPVMAAMMAHGVGY